MDKTILDTEDLRKKFYKSAGTISDKKIRKQAEEWLVDYYIPLKKSFTKNEKVKQSIEYLKTSSTNNRLIRKKWLSNLNVILKIIKEDKYANSKNQNGIKRNYKEILTKKLLDEIKKVDTKIYVLGIELNQNWDSKVCNNSCGILMRIILERSLDKKDASIKAKNGLKNKINYCLSSNIFGKSISEALKKLDNSTKITGDIVAHDSNILLVENDIELAIIPFRLLLTDIF